FVLCSLYEGLGAVMIEAAMAGLPVLCHPHGGSRYILQDSRWFVDMSESGNLSRRLIEWRERPLSTAVVRQLHDSVHERFNEGRLARDFEEMVQKVFVSSELSSRALI
ncbi:MAG: glycosyltransferase, partial [Candidatus Obscuribacterales bacterium]|nr:glycosyltransferase [Candidatus Obscuribacterales bacterium]